MRKVTGVNTMSCTVSTVAGPTSSIAGFVDGTGPNARFNAIREVAIENAGSVLVADYLNNAIRRVQPDGTTTTVAGQLTAGNFDGIGTNAKFYNPRSVTALDSGVIFVADANNHCIRCALEGFLRAAAVASGRSNR